ncbi:hypothetical protein AVEN_9370-1 [Araneus ventricosus]|uniref:Uncharacterized protein n=1 Tax=Araneus ventricosus TaxID=182803 RepID=A0A4Y2DKR4_ARAVE|nr:hypothetical protein AVEN_9370-1 [Araneus ventricosus]
MRQQRSTFKLNYIRGHKSDKIVGNISQVVNVDSELEAKVKLFRDELNDLQNIFKNVSEKQSSNAQDKDDFSNLKEDILLLYIEAVSFVVPDKKMESDHSGAIMDLFIELENEFASFRQGIYNKVNGFSKQLSPSTDNIQSDKPLSPVSPSSGGLDMKIVVARSQ